MSKLNLPQTHHHPRNIWVKNVYQNDIIYCENVSNFVSYSVGSTKVSNDTKYPDFFLSFYISIY